MVFVSSCLLDVVVKDYLELRQLVEELDREGFTVSAKLKINDNPRSKREYIERVDDGVGQIYVKPCEEDKIRLALEYRGYHVPEMLPVAAD